MSPRHDVIVVGGGVGCLCAAIILGAAGLDVLLLESASTLGGKAAQIEREGIAMDTGPSVLTLPGVFESVFGAVGLRFEDEVLLHRPSPAFRYIYSDGPTLDVFHEVDRTIESVRSTLGPRAAQELADYLAHAERIWRAAEPHFVTQAAPSLQSLIGGGWAAWKSLGAIDPFRSMAQTINQKVRDPHIATLLKRYATYNGSDVRRAPGTLGCIAHVELSLGGFGVKGGMYTLVEALARALGCARVAVELNAHVTRICVTDGMVNGVQLADGRLLRARQVVFGGDARALESGLLDTVPSRLRPADPSMSAHTFLFKASDQREPRVAHTVIFPPRYEQEFEDIFDHRRVPTHPTIYACDQRQCHLRASWPSHSPLFAMINAPALASDYDGGPDAELMAQLRAGLVRQGLIAQGDACLWWRTPRDLADRFTASQGSLYGSSSNGMMAAFRRPSNTSAVRGLFLASGSAHPGGGLPMVAQSGKLAAQAALRQRSQALSKELTGP